VAYRASYDRYGIEAPPKALEGWRFGRASGKPALRIMGDSQTFGQVSAPRVNTGADSFRTRLAVALAAKIPGGLAAEYHPIIYNAALATLAGYAWAGTPPWVINVTPIGTVVPGGQTIPYNWQAGLAAAATWHTAVGPLTLDQVLATFNDTNVLPTFQDADIWSNRTTNSSPPFRYSLDGAASVAAANVTSQDGLMNVIQLRGMGNTSHEIRIMAPGGGSLQMWIDGVTTYYNPIVAGVPANGLYYAPVGFPGGDFEGYSSIVWDNIAGYNGTAYGALDFPSASHAIIIAHGLNDMSRIAADSFADRVQAFVRLQRRAAEIKYGSGFLATVIIIGEDAPDQGTWGLLAGPGDSGRHGGLPVAGEASWQPFSRVIRDLADTIDAIFIDLSMLINARGLAKGYYINNEAHFTIAGHQMIADAIASVLP
jgi:hypothetical protein